MHAIILAAGYATRLYPLTLDRPKALLEIGGKPIIDYICGEIGTLPAISRTIIVSNDKFYPEFRAWASGHRACGALTVLNDGSRYEEGRLGAVGDIWFAITQERIDDDLLIIAGDNFFTYHLADLYAFYESVRADCVVVKREKDARLLRNFGVAVVDPSWRVLEFEEKPEKPKSDLAVYATYIYRRDTLPLIGQYLREGNKPDAPGNFPAWLCSRKRLMAFMFDGECYDIGTIESYERVCRMCSMT